MAEHVLTASDEEAVSDNTLFVSAACHLCGKVKESWDSQQRADYLLAFHYDRRHRGWTA